MSLYMQNKMPNFQTEQAIFLMEDQTCEIGSEEEIVLLSTSLDNLCFKADVDEGSSAFLDGACPTTVAGTQWTREFLSKLSQAHKTKSKQKQVK